MKNLLVVVAQVLVCKSMKIVKSFDDFEYYNKVYDGPNDPSKDRWTWGLGDDGEIYWQSSDELDPFKWHLLKGAGWTRHYLSLRVMKRLVKEFEHLLVFL